MIARAPGKIVLSGAYAVLEGAPAIVAAVDRFVIADGARDAELVTPEVAAAIHAGALDRAPWFDAAALRAGPHGERKLGLGSSAAILVASMAARRSAGEPADVDAARAELLEPALVAHRSAQRGGSGVDVAASVYGGVLACAIVAGGRLDIRAHPLPPGTRVSVFASDEAASTRAMLERVRALEQRDRRTYRALLDRAAYAARVALAAPSVAELAGQLDQQYDALAELGAAAGAPILTPQMGALRPRAHAEAASFGPAGAGGGDIAVFVGAAGPSAAFLVAASALGMTPLPLEIGAPGVAWQG